MNWTTAKLSAPAKEVKVFGFRLPLLHENVMGQLLRGRSSLVETVTMSGEDAPREGRRPHRSGCDKIDRDFGSRIEDRSKSSSQRPCLSCGKGGRLCVRENRRARTA